MKNLFITTLMLSLSVLLMGCNDSSAPLFEDPEQADNRVTGHYQASFFVIEGDCYDVEDVDLVIFKGHMREPHEELSYSIDGNAYMDGGLSGTAEGDFFYPVTFSGSIDNDGFSGNWSSEECSGIFMGEYIRAFTERENLTYDAL